MRESGRASKVLHPSPHHESLTYRAPRTTGGYPSQSKTIHLTQISKCDKVLLAGL
jgi:hypothetical protein